jgi:hypothetical protein
MGRDFLLVCSHKRMQGRCGRVHAPPGSGGCKRHGKDLPMCLLSSLMKDTQNLRISLSDLPLGSKSQPPLAPPMFRPVRAFLKICSKPKNLRMDRLTVGCRRRPPLYGPRAELNWTR